MFGLFKKQKEIQDLTESDLQKIFNEAEIMYSSFSKEMYGFLTSQSENLERYKKENDTFWINKTKQSIEEMRKIAAKVQGVREDIIRLSEREAQSSIENRFYIVRDWHVYMHTFLNWNANIIVRDTSTQDGLNDIAETMEAARAKDIKLEEIAKRLKAKLAQTK